MPRVFMKYITAHAFMMRAILIMSLYLFLILIFGLCVNSLNLELIRFSTMAAAAPPTPTLGAVRDTDSDFDSIARFAVDQHNRNQGALLELVKVVKAQEQTVAGTLHHLTLEVVDAGKKTLYEAKVWVKPWLDFKELQEFKHLGDHVPSFTPSDLGAKKEELVSGWKSVPVDDPVVQDAAHHAVKTIQQRSNSLYPYVLSEIVHANAEVVETCAKFDMLLKVKRGEGKEEKFNVKVHRSEEGGFHLKEMANN